MGNAEARIANRPRDREALKVRDIVGPGLVTGASDDDPSGIATYSQAGAQFGFGLSWTLVATYPLMAAVQMISARIGRATGEGIAGNLRHTFPNWLLLAIVGLLLFANTINLGADLGAMADAARLVLGGPHYLYLVVFAAICALLQVFVKYARYVAILKWLTLTLLAYVITLFMVQVPWSEALHGLVVPQFSLDAHHLTMIVAIFGTTISPYLFFWQASEEAEDVHEQPERKPLNHAPEQGPTELKRINLDTLVGMGASNLVALAIILTTAATLHPAGITDIQTSAQAAQALQPVAGPYAKIIFALGIVGTGLLAVPVLAGSAAYAIGEAARWPVGLARQPKKAKAFYGTIVVATLVGAAINFTAINPIKALFWTAVINGVLAVPVMAIMMLICSRQSVMGAFAVKGPLRWFGWLATFMTGCTVAAMGIMALQGSA